jgi:hypothetical protein
MIPSPPVMLMVAALVAAGMGVRQRRRTRPAPVRAAGVQLPGAVAALARVPVPPALLPLAQRPDFARTLVAAGMPGLMAVDTLRRARAGGMVMGALVSMALGVFALPLAMLAPVIVIGLRLLPDRLVAARAVRRRLAIIREEIGWDRKLMVDANQVWDVPTAIEWTKALAPFKPWWIEEPTSPDDILGHAAAA